MPATSVPLFKTEEDAANWFDTQDTSELPLEILPPDENGVATPQPALETIAVRVSRREVDELKRRAAHLGIGYTTYVRILINRHVLDEPPIG
ncbi:MAG: CopG antitoxin of type toxin-antitoxin system [Chloroflexi bacterium]|nr:CopG antitoxin of type toxin-antitoxin system [Chloroflexota bacterium]